MKSIKFLTAFILAVSLLAGDSWGKPSSSSGGSSRPSTSSSRPSASPKPSSRPSASSPKPSTRPNTSSPNNSVAPSTKPSTRPNSVVDSKLNSSNSNSTKPTKSYDQAAAASQKKVESRTAYKAATQPKAEYKTPDGKTVKVDPKAPAVDTVRKSVDSNKYANRTTRVENHYHTHYGDRYDYYRSRPYIDIGGGYSPIFWYMMMDWSMERRAQWMYNNQSNMNQQLYQQELAKNAQLRTQVESLKTKGAPDPTYVDPEFKNDPDLQYSDEFVAAAYNPESSNVGLVFLWILGGICLSSILFLAYYLVFVKDWKGLS